MDKFLLSKIPQPLLEIVSTDFMFASKLTDVNFNQFIEFPKQRSSIYHDGDYQGNYNYFSISRMLTNGITGNDE